MFEKRSSVVKDASKLAFEYVPDTVVCRGEQQRMLEDDFRPLASGGHSCSAFVTGGVGTGKTVTVKRFCLDMAAYFAKNGGRLDTVYVNCRIKNSEYAAVLEIIRSFDPGFPDRGFSVDEMMTSVKRHVIDGKQPVVVILDEADVLLRNSSRNVIYQLSRFSEDTGGRGSLSLILISQYSLATMLDEASMSTFRRANAVRFDRYSEGELGKIVRARADVALNPDTLGEESAGMIASLAASYGDARFAIEVLERSSQIAESNGDAEITPDDVRTAGSSIYSDVSESKLESLDRNKQIALLSISRSIKGSASVKMTVSEKTYAVVCEEYNVPAKKHTQFYTYVQDMEHAGLLKTVVKREPDGGRVTYISIENIPPRELAKKLEYILDCVTNEGESEL